MISPGLISNRMIAPFGPVLATFMPKTITVIWMPAIMKLYHLPDMAE
jgi:hypothetical protein